MKTIKILLISIGILFVTTQVVAVTSTDSAIINKTSPTSKPATSSSAISQLEQFKDKLESKVEELQKNNNVGYAGYISSISGKTIQIKGEDATYKIVVDDVVTVIYDIVGVSKKEAKLASFEKGDFIIASGPKNGQEIDANTIYRDVHYLAGSGKITEVNKSDFYLTVATEDKDIIKLDIESSTKKNLLNIKTLKSEPIGFTNIKEGDTVNYILKDNVDAQEKKRFSAVRVFIIPQEFFIK